MLNKILVRRDRSLLPSFILAGFLLFAVGCSPTIKVEPPDKPITVNLNVKIDHEVRIKVDKELDQVLSKDSPLF